MLLSSAESRILTGKVLIASAGSNITVCSRKYGVQIFSIAGLTRRAKYEWVTTCPLAEDIKKSLEYADSYHCIGGSGDATCGPDFGGFTAAQQAIARKGLYFPYESFTSMFSGCFVTGTANRCTALAIKDNHPEMFIVKKISEDCEAIVNRLEGPTVMERLRYSFTNRVFGNNGIQMTLINDCRAVFEEYAIIAPEGKGFRIYQEENSKAMFYAHSCPIYKDVINGQWKYRRAMIHHSGGNYGYSITMEWHGKPKGINLTVYPGVKIGKFALQETISKAHMEYSVEVDDDDDLDCETTENVSRKCTQVDVTTYEHKYWGVDQGMGIISHGICGLKSDAHDKSPCYLMTAMVTNNGRQYPGIYRVFSHERSCVVYYKGPGFLEGIRGTGKSVLGQIPEYTVIKTDYKDVDIIHSRPGVSFDIASWLKSPLKVIEEYLFVVLMIALVVLFPGFFFSKVGIVVVVVVIIYAQFGVSEASVIDDTLDGLSVYVSIDGFGWYRLVAVAAQIYAIFRGKHWAYVVLDTAIYVIDLKYQNEVVSVLSCTVRILIGRDDRVAYYADEALCKAEELLGDKLLIPMSWKMAVIKKSIYGMYNMSVVFGSFKQKRRKVRKAMKGKIRNVRNMRGTILYDHEYEKAKDFLKCLSEREIGELYHRLDPITIRESLPPDKDVMSLFMK